MNNLVQQYIVTQVKQLVQNAQHKAIRAINQERVLLYWKIGERIMQEEQKGKQRASYGIYLIKTLAKELKKEFGSGFSAR